MPSKKSARNAAKMSRPTLILGSARAAPKAKAACPMPIALYSPAKQRCPYREPSAHRGQQYQIALFQPALFSRCLHRQRNSSRRGVPVAIDVDDYALRLQPYAVRRGLDNSLICLMRNKAINVVGGEAISRQQLFANLAHFSDRVFQNCPPVLMDEIHLFIPSVLRLPTRAAPAAH